MTKRITVGRIMNPETQHRAGTDGQHGGQHLDFVSVYAFANRQTTTDSRDMIAIESIDLSLLKIHNYKVTDSKLQQVGEG